MNKLLLLFGLTILFLLSTHQGIAAIAIQPTNQAKTNISRSTNKAKINIRDLEVKIGRKLKWHEKLGLKLFKKKLRKKQKAKNKKKDGFAIAGFILSVLGILLPLSGLGLPGLILSKIGLKRINKAPEKKGGKQLAKWGRDLGIIGIILSVIASIVIWYIFY